jgi:predicted RNA binding protein YcfA (HicA-like mRNA interferase family)/DNA-directed RNA polymerase subunit RPC12/RpoP
VGAMVALSNRDCVKLLESWGFREVGYNGGHIVMEYNGKRVQMSAPGRKMPTPYKSLKKAARLIGVTLPEFLAGPTSEPKKRTRWEQPAATPEEEKEETMTAVAVEEPVGTVLKCSECGKDDFATTRGFKGHLRSHEKATCPHCGTEIVRIGLGAHVKFCPKNESSTRASTKPRRRRPIAEVPGVTRGSGRQASIEVEVPLLEDAEDFPTPEAFTAPVTMPVMADPVVEAYVKAKETGVPQEIEGGGVIDETGSINYDQDDYTEDAEEVLAILLPGVEPTPELAQAMDEWIKATRLMLSQLIDRS